MTARPRRAGLALAALLATVVAAAAPAVPAGATVAVPDRAGVAERGPAPVSLTVADLRPRAPQPGGDLQLVGTMRNAGPQAVTDLQLLVRVGNRLSTRSELHRADTSPPVYRDRAVQQVADLESGVQLPVDLRVAVDELRLGADGIYPLQVELRGRRTGSSTRVRLAVVSTYLPWFRTTALDPLRIAWLWPLVDRPRMGPREVFLSDELASSLQPDGRLGRSLTAARAGEAGTCAPPAEPVEAPTPPTGAAPVPTSPAAAAAAPAELPAPCAPVPVTYAVDPDLLFSARAMTGPYPVLAPGGTTRPGEGTAAATGWLAALQAATAGTDVLALPYADQDVAAVVDSDTDLAADVAAARTYGATVTREVLGREPLQAVAFPPAGRLSDAAFDALTTASTQAVVLSGDAVPDPPAGARSTAGARIGPLASSTSGRVAGLVPDQALSDLLVPAADTDPRLAEQRWLVETAMIAAELPSRGRTLLVAPPRRAAVDPAVAGAAVADTGRVPWMCPVRLADVAAGREACPGGPAAPDDTRDVDLLQPDPRVGPLAPALLAAVGSVREAAAQFTGAIILGGTEQAQATRTRMQRAWLRGESSAWRDDRSAGARLVALAADDVADLRGKVSVLTGSITLTSNNGSVSVAVVNELDQPVTVALRLRAPSEARLSRAQTDVLVVPARTSLPVQVDARTRTSGRFVVKAQLLDRAGVPFGEPRDLRVRSTRFGAVALAVTGLGAAVLLLAVGARLVRRGRQRPAEPAPGSS